MPYLSDDALATSAAANAAVPMAQRSGIMFHGAIMDASVVRETRVQAPRMRHTPPPPRVCAPLVARAEVTTSPLPPPTHTTPQMVQMLNHHMRNHHNASTLLSLQTEEVAVTSHEQPDGLEPVQVVASADAMRAARLCLVPEGDSPMSRRLEDALAAGCVPVLYLPVDEATDGRRRTLPFAHTIDWREVAFFMKVSDCPDRDAQWLEKVHGDVPTLERMAAAGRAAYTQYLSFGNRSRAVDAAPIDMVSALLHEVAML